MEFFVGLWGSMGVLCVLWVLEGEGYFGKVLLVRVDLKYVNIIGMWSIFYCVIF